jgi:hypothetical protein
VSTAAKPARESFLRKHTEVIIAVLLGLVSVATAYSSFQAALYDGKVIEANTQATTLATEAESLYLEGNQQYVQDAQLFDRLTDLRLDIENPDAAISVAAQIKYDTIYFQSVSEEFDAAIQAADAQNEADPDFYFSPLDDEDYQAFLFGGYAETKDRADAALEQSKEFDGHGDLLTLTTVLMALSLFLLGISAVVRAFRVRLILGGVSIVIFVLALAMTVTVPFVGL